MINYFKTLAVCTTFLIGCFIITTGLYTIRIEQCGETIDDLRWNMVKAQHDINLLSCIVACLDDIDTYKCQERCKADLE